MTESDIYEPYERLVLIRVLGRDASVPENNLLLRCFQYLEPAAVPYGDFCWNGDCLNCRISLRRDGQTQDALACQTVVREGDEVLALSPELRRVMKRWSVP